MDDIDVFYFFKKGMDTITCEVRTSETGSGYDIVITEPNGAVRAETYPTSEAVHKIWLELLERFQHDGWWGRTFRTEGRESRRLQRGPTRIQFVSATWGGEKSVPSLTLRPSINQVEIRPFA